MALESQSKIESFRFEGPQASINSSLIMILLWTLWLSFFTTLSVPLRLSLHGSSFLLLIGAFWWNLKEGAFYILLMSLIFSFFSLTPSGFFWISAFSIFVILRFVSHRFSLSSPYQVMFGIFLISLFLELTQAFMMGQVLSVQVLSWKLLLSIFYSAVLQALVGWLSSQPLLTLVESK